MIVNHRACSDYFLHDDELTLQGTQGKLSPTGIIHTVNAKTN